MIPKEVVHYTKKDTAMEKILFEKKIRFSLLGMTKDPRETKTWDFTIKTKTTSMLYLPDVVRPHDLSYKINEIANKIMTNEWKVFCVTKHFRSNITKVDNFSFENNYFKYGYSHPRLWADYGEQHSGVCLIFDGKKLNQNIHKALSPKCRIFQGSVTYNDLSAISAWEIDISEIEKHDAISLVREYFFLHYKSCFLTKTIDWKSENEYRWLIHNTTKKPEFVSIEGAIKGVLVGADFPPKYEETLKSLCKELNIPAGKINWSNGQPRVSHGSIYTP
jgi:hypothetical protein